MRNVDDLLPPAIRTSRDAEPALDTQPGGATIISLIERLPQNAAARRRQLSGELVDQVADRISMMVDRTRELEHYIQHFEQWSSEQVDLVETVADHWKNVTSAAELRMDQLQRSLEASKRRAELAECDLQNVRFRLEALHDRISKVFGATSRFRATREVVGFE